MTDVQIVYFNAGGGHRAAARALEAVIQTRFPAWNLRCINLFEILDPHSQFRRIAGIAPEDFYNKQLALGWTAGLDQQLKFLHAMVRAAHSVLVRRLRAHWQRTQPDLVVSVIPNIDLALHDSVREALPTVPFVTVMTDLADFPPHFWIEPGTSQHVIAGTPRAYQQALDQGMPPAQVHQVSGMIVRPDFYEPLEIDRARERAALGLDPSKPVGVVMFGGHGSMAMLSIARQLRDVQLILMCGHNESLARKLRARGVPGHAVVEFTSDVRYYMQLGDFFIGKPGPGSLSEAVQQGLPVITVRNRWTMPQERYNTDWVREHQLGIIVDSTKKIGTAAFRLLEEIERYRHNVARMTNNAVFEVPEILNEILEASRATEAVRSRSPQLVPR
jgi:1,2-diacylglycerol 3-beta-galactosyltransferase